MVDHPSLTLMQASYEALGSGDTGYLQSTATPDFTFEVSGSSAISGKSNSVEEALTEMQRSAELTAGDMTMQPQYMLAGDDIGVALIHVTASRPDGRTLEQRLIHEWRYAGGKVAGIREWIWDQEADVKFWA